MPRGSRAATALQLPLLDGWSEAKLIALCVALGAAAVGPWSPAEEALRSDLPRIDPATVESFRQQVRLGADPLGDLFSILRSPAARRPMGATYTPSAIVHAMMERAAQLGRPERIVDPGCGSARFLLAAARAFPAATLIGFEIDPTAAMMARANLAAAGFSDRATIMLQDFCAANLPASSGPTLFVGNPPYVRHHFNLSFGQAVAGEPGGDSGVPGQSACRAARAFLPGDRVAGPTGRLRRIRHRRRVAGRELRQPRP